MLKAREADLSARERPAGQGPSSAHPELAARHQADKKSSGKTPKDALAIPTLPPLRGSAPTMVGGVGVTTSRVAAARKIQVSARASQDHRPVPSLGLTANQPLVISDVAGSVVANGHIEAASTAPSSSVQTLSTAVPPDALPAYTAALSTHFASEGGGSARIILHPANLGTITLNVSFTPAGALSVRMVAEKPAGLQAATAAANGMAQHLSQAGFQVLSVQATQGASNQTTSFAGNGGSSSGQNYHQPHVQPPEPPTDPAGSGEADQTVVAYA
jgi:hypothetical protein